MAALPTAYKNPALEASMKVQEQLRNAIAPSFLANMVSGSALSEKLRKMVTGDIFQSTREAVSQLDDLSGMRRIKELTEFPGTDYAGKLLAFRDTFSLDNLSQSELIKKYSGFDAGVDYLGSLNSSLDAFKGAQKTLEGLIPDWLEIDQGNYNFDESEQAELVTTAGALARAEIIKSDLRQYASHAAVVVSKQENPWVKVLLIAIFLEILKAMLSWQVGVMMTQYAPHGLGGSPQGETKAVQEHARRYFGSPEFLSAHRFVSVKELQVRQNPRSRSPSVGSLKFGYAVEVLKKEGDFTLIQWQGKGEQADAQIQGWVFSRYLEKFK